MVGSECTTNSLGSEERMIGSPWGAVVATPEQRELKDYTTW